MSEESNDNLGPGWGWWIIFLTLCVIQSCDQSENNKDEINELRNQIQQNEQKRPKN